MNNCKQCGKRVGVNELHFYQGFCKQCSDKNAATKQREGDVQRAKKQFIEAIRWLEDLGYSELELKCLLEKVHVGLDDKDL